MRGVVLLARCKRRDAGCVVQQALCVWQCGALRDQVVKIRAKCEILRQLAHTTQLDITTYSPAKSPGDAGVNSPSFQRMKGRVVSSLREATECLESTCTVSTRSSRSRRVNNMYRSNMEIHDHNK